jgi:hypothetical protein
MYHAIENCVGNGGYQFNTEISRSSILIELLRKEEKKLLSETGGEPGTSRPLLGYRKQVGETVTIQLTEQGGALEGIIREIGAVDNPNHLNWYKTNDVLLKGIALGSGGGYNASLLEYAGDKECPHAGGTYTPVIIQLRTDNEALTVSGRHKQYGDRKNPCKWSNSYGRPFKYSFIKVSTPD